MKDSSYEILELMERYGADEAGIKEILEQDDRPEILLALSPIRENLVEWIWIGPEDKVLEIGSGAGAVTGILAKKAKEVLVVDPLLEALEVDKRRHASLGNIRYACGSLEELQGSEVLEGQVFDWVFLLCPQADEATEKEGQKGALVEKAAAMTAEGGHLVLALPNAQALKLWAGAKADPQELSMSLEELKGLFAGLGGQASFYYPLPDHKLPVAVYSDGYLPVKGELPSLSAEYERSRYRLFSEEAAYDALTAAGSFPQFANSYLVIWRKGYGADTIR